MSPRWLRGSKVVQPVSARPQTAPPTGGRAPAERQCAFVTLLTQDAYLPGAQALHRSLRLVGSRYPLLVMYTDSVSQGAVEALAREGMQLQFTKQFEPEGVDHSEYKRALYLQCWNKLRMWEMTEYARLVYLDADMAVLRNIDHLFELPPGFYAVGDCYGGREFEEEGNSCCHFTPDATPEYFNAGFCVLTPSLAELEGMKAALREGRIPVLYFAEQDFLNGYFKGRWRHLPHAYNAQKRIKYHHPELWDLSQIAVIHYVDEKPWSHRYSEENLAYKEECDFWWDVYEGRLAPRQPAVRQMSTGLSSLLPAPDEPQPAPSAVASARRGLSAAPAAAAASAPGRASSLPSPLPQVRAS